MKLMTGATGNHLWNGIGTSHAAEILHLARIHPQELTGDIFGDYTRKYQLLHAIRQFFASAYSFQYTKHVPSSTTARFGFEMPPHITRYINEVFIEVYQKEKCYVTYAHYNELQTAGLLAPEFQQLPEGWEEDQVTDSGRLRRKVLPVYKCQFAVNGSGKV